MPNLITEYQRDLYSPERDVTYTYSDLQRLCRDAARAAVGKPYSPDDRAECAAAIMADVLAAVAADAPDAPQRSFPHNWRPLIARRGDAELSGPARVRHLLRYIGTALDAPPPRAERSLPLRSDVRVTFTALKRRAKDWRVADTARRERDAIWSGARDATATPPPPAVTDREHARQLAALDMRAARTAATDGAAALSMPGDDAVFSLLYQWARDISPARAAAELGVSLGAFQVRSHRAARRIRESYGLADLVTALTDGDSPAVASRDYFTRTDGRRSAAAHIIAAGANLLCPLDESRAALRRTESSGIKLLPTLTDRYGTAGGERPTPSLTAADARAACVVRRRRPSPVAAERRRAAADRADGLTAEHRAAVAAGRLATAQALSTGRPNPAAVGRTAGKPPAKYAPRAVRLGKSAG